MAGTERTGTKVNIFSGVLLSLALALMSSILAPWVAIILPIPPLVIALVMGVLLHPWVPAASFATGLRFCVSRILRIAVALLGLRVAIGDIADLGIVAGLVIVAAMILTILFGLWFAQILGLSRAFGALAGVATAVCGASAALATSTVLPKYEAKEAETVFVIVAVNLLSTIAMVAYPPLAQFLGFNDLQTGILLGGTIHDVAQVVGAGFSVNESVGASSVVVKLFRVLLLLPVILIVGRFFLKPASDAKVPVPVFAFGFLLLCLVNSSIHLLPGLIPVYSLFKSAAETLSTWGFLVAIAALGLGTSLQSIAKLGIRHILTVTGTTLVILGAVGLGLFLEASLKLV